jgi:hemoglobin
VSDSTSPTLFEQAGGEAGIADLTFEFYRRVLSDPKLMPFFTDVSIKKMQTMQREFFAAAMDGPIAYSGRPLSQVHAGLGIRTTHLQLFLDHLLASLKNTEIDEQDIYEIVSRLNTYADEITGETSVDG